MDSFDCPAPGWLEPKGKEKTKKQKRTIVLFWIGFLVLSYRFFSRTRKTHPNTQAFFLSFSFFNFPSRKERRKCAASHSALSRRETSPGPRSKDDRRSALLPTPLAPQRKTHRAFTFHPQLQVPSFACFHSCLASLAEPSVQGGAAMLAQ